MNICERLINSHPQVITVLVSAIVLGMFSYLSAMFHGIEMAFWLLQESLASRYVRKGKFLFGEILFGVSLLSVIHILFLYVIHTSNTGYKARFEMNMWEYAGVFIIGISLYLFLIWKYFRVKR